MTEHDKRFAARLADELRNQFQSVRIACAPSGEPALSDCDGVLMLDVYDAPSSLQDEITDFCMAKTLDHCLSGGGLLNVALWTHEESRVLEGRPAASEKVPASVSFETSPSKERPCMFGAPAEWEGGEVASKTDDCNQEQPLPTEQSAAPSFYGKAA